MCLFEHVDGCRFCEALYGHYLLPSGRLAHFYLGDTVIKVGGGEQGVGCAWQASAGAAGRFLDRVFGLGGPWLASQPAAAGCPCPCTPTPCQPTNQPTNHDCSPTPHPPPVPALVLPPRGPPLPPGALRRQNPHTCLPTLFFPRVASWLLQGHRVDLVATPAIPFSAADWAHDGFQVGAYRYTLLCFACRLMQCAGLVASDDK